MKPSDKYDFRPRTSDELQAYRQLMQYVFAGDPPPEEEEDQEPDPLLPEWSLCAFDGDKMIASSGTFPFKIRFNGATMAASGVTAVGTDPGYRRQGIVRELMTRLLHQGHENGVPAAILWASRGAIYQRFGYGLATSHVTYDVDVRDVRFQFGDEPEGTIRLLGKEEAMPVLAELYRQFSGERNLMIHRAPQMWDAMIPAKRTPYLAAYYDAAGHPRGYCIYRTDNIPNIQPPTPAHRLELTDFCWLDMNAYRGIWSYLASHDLVKHIQWIAVPEDDPATGLVLEPRMLQRRTQDGVWLRLIDAEAALASRPYNAPGEALIRVANDDLCPWNAGCYRIASSGEQAEVEKTSGAGDADITIGINGLASLASGHASATWLCRIGRAEALRPERLAIIDALFATRYRPTCPNEF